MPNYVTNEITSSAKALKLMLNSQTKDVEFNIVKPMPELYEEFGGLVHYSPDSTFRKIISKYISNSGFTRQDWDRWAKDWNLAQFTEFAHQAVQHIDVVYNHDLHTDWEKFKKDEMFETYFKQAILELACKTKYGFADPLDWARANWGTKWNAGCINLDEAEVDHLLASEDSATFTIRFDTAWDCPIAYLETLSKQVPETQISVKFADEDLGSNCGEFILQDGKMIESEFYEYSDQSMDFACQLLYGMSYEEYLNEECE